MSNDDILSTPPRPALEAPDVIVVKGVSKRFTVRKDNSLKERLVTLGKMGRRHRQDFWALNDVDVRIQAGTTVGLIGQNGSGKSTLLKAIGGIIQPTTGTVSRRGRLAALLELGAGFHPDLTGRENVYLNAALLGLTRHETEDRFDDIVTFSGIGDFIDTQVKFYSSGMYVRLAFAVAVHTDPDVLLVDEVLAVGDEAFQRKCLDKIRSFQAEGRTIIIVTHSLAQVQELCTRAVFLNKGTVMFDGEPNDAVAMFRDLLEDRRQTEAEQAHDPVVGSGHVTSVSVSASGRVDDTRILPGDDLEVTMEFEHATGMDDWIAALQINSASGQVVYGTTSTRMGVDLPPLQGTRKLKFVLKDVSLGEGKYFVNASLMDPRGVHVHDLPQGASFDVPAYALAVGTVHAEPELVQL
jgi:ABC-2 type transport system ATP-binding protein